MEENNNVENTPVVEQKPKKKGTIIIIVLLVLIALGVGGYFCYDKFIAKKTETNNNSKTKDDKQEEIVPSNEPEEKDEIEIEEDDSDDNQFCGEKPLIKNDALNNKLSSGEKEVLEEANNLLVNIRYLYTLLKESTKINDLSNQDKLWLIYFNYKDNYFEQETSDVLLKRIQSLFGSTFNVQFEDLYVEDLGKVWEYNPSTRKYTNVGGGGAYVVHISNYKPVKLEEKNNKYYISYEILYKESFDGPLGYINASGNEIKPQVEAECDYLKESDYNKIKDKLNIVTFVFEKEDEKLVLTEYIK